MPWLAALMRTVVELIRSGLIEGWTALGVVCRQMAALIRSCRAERARRPGREGRSTEQWCVPIREPAFKRPDPTIYCQTFLMAQGFAVTWDNPDIVLRHQGVEVSSSALLPDTEYEIVARIWNNSTEAPVVDLPVRFSFVSFGIGTVNTPIADSLITLGVKGGPQHPAFAVAKWRTPAAPGHYCLQVLLDWFDDINMNNNLGQENTTVATAQSPAEIMFALRNATRERQGYRFAVDAYVLPEPPLCPRERPVITDQNAARMPGRLQPPVLPEHDPRRHPIPEGWSIALEPPQPMLAPGEEITVTARITPPPHFRGRQPFNINAFHREEPAGGVTVIVQAS